VQVREEVLVGAVDGETGESVEHREDVAGVDCACERPLDLAT
jgi:hypothetical protein